MSIDSFSPSVDNQVADRIYALPISGLFFIAAPQHRDFRGFYTEVVILDDLQKIVPSPFIPRQCNLARSVTHVARGFHAEQWNKLVTVVSGKAFCAWVDLRPHSATFGKAVTLEMGPEAQYFGSVYVSKGIANGYVVLEGPVDYYYQTDGLYRERNQQFDTPLSLFDDEVGIEWPIPRMEMLLSQRDKQAVSLASIKMQYQQ